MRILNCFRITSAIKLSNPFKVSTLIRQFWELEEIFPKNLRHDSLSGVMAFNHTIEFLMLKLSITFLEGYYFDNVEYILTNFMCIILTQDSNCWVCIHASFI